MRSSIASAETPFKAWVEGSESSEFSAYRSFSEPEWQSPGDSNSSTSTSAPASPYPSTANGVGRQRVDLDEGWAQSLSRTWHFAKKAGPGVLELEQGGRSLAEVAHDLRFFAVGAAQARADQQLLLSLADCQPGEGHVALRAQLAKSPVISGLLLSGAGHYDYRSVFALLAGQQHQCALELRDFSSDQLCRTFDGLAAWSAGKPAPSCANITTLKISSEAAGTLALGVLLQAVTHLPGLEQVDFRGSRLSEGDATHMQAVLHAMGKKLSLLV